MGIDLDYRDTEWFALETEIILSFLRLHPSISDLFVDFDGDSISSKKFLPTVDIVVHISFQISDFSLAKNLDVELLDCMIVLFFIFGGPSILLFIVKAIVYIPTNHIQGLPFLHILITICYFFLFICLGEGEGGIIRENSIETSTLPYVK